MRVAHKVLTDRMSEEFCQTGHSSRYLTTPATSLFFAL